LPDGKHFLYTTNTRSATGADEWVICVASLDGKVNRHLVTADLRMAYASGYLLYQHQQGKVLMARPFDANSLELTGEAVTIAELAQSGLNLRFSVSQNGILVYRGRGYESESRWQLFWFDPARRDKNLGSIGDSERYWRPRLSPDGKKIAGGISNLQSQNTDIWIYDLTRKLRTRFTFEPSAEGAPLWSPDGNRIVFHSTRKGHYDLYQQSASDTGEEELLFASNVDKWPTDWSSDGQFIAYTIEFDPKTKMDIWIIPLLGDRKPVPFLQTEFNEQDARFSPDMQWIAYQSNESGRHEIYVRPFPGKGQDGKWQISTNGGVSPAWRRDGKELFYVSLEDFKLTAVEVNGTGSIFEVGAIRPLFGISLAMYDVTADGQRFLVPVREREPSYPPLTLVTNWDQELKKK
jgi:hypothetical protein